jgi:hypothetical protein
MQYFLSHPEFVSGTYLDYALIGGLAASQSCLIAPLATTVHHKYGIKLAVGDHNGRDRHRRADLFNGCTYNDGPMGPQLDIPHAGNRAGCSVLLLCVELA